ncbi:hypothetical protein EMCRGX_G033255 [Ephydatia muelleri]
MLKKCCNQAELCGVCSATSEGKQGSPDALFRHLVEKYSFASLGMPSAGIRDVLVVSMKEEESRFKLSTRTYQEVSLSISSR